MHMVHVHYYHRWLDLKTVLVRKNRKVAMKSKRRWKKYWGESWERDEDSMLQLCVLLSSPNFLSFSSSPSLSPPHLPSHFSFTFSSLLPLSYLSPTHSSLATLKGSTLLLYQCDDITNLSESAHVDLRLGKQNPLKLHYSIIEYSFITKYTLLYNQIWKFVIEQINIVPMRFLQQLNISVLGPSSAKLIEWPLWIQLSMKLGCYMLGQGQRTEMFCHCEKCIGTMFICSITTFEFAL